MEYWDEERNDRHDGYWVHCIDCWAQISDDDDVDGEIEVVSSHSMGTEGVVVNSDGTHLWRLYPHDVLIGDVVVL